MMLENNDKEERILAVRASNRRHNGSFRRKIRAIAAENPEAATIVENEIKIKQQTKEEFPVKKVMKIHNINEPILYPTWLEPTFNTPDAFIGCEEVLKNNIIEFKNMSEKEIRKQLVEEYKTNHKLYSTDEISAWMKKTESEYSK